MLARVSNHYARLAGLAGWRRNMAAFFLGVCATLTLAPFFLFPFIIPAFTGLYLLLAAAPSARRAFADGWWWGWGFYISGLYWLCVALLTDPDKFAWLIPFALFGITAIIALYSAAACWIASRLRLRGLGGIVIFSVLWTCVEYARGHWFSGFPWNLPGYALGFSAVTLQPASLIGIYGLSWFTVLLGASFAALKEKSGLAFLAVVWGIFALSIGWGAWRLQQADLAAGGEAFVPGINLRLVQADISQPNKWDPALINKGIREHIALSQSPGIEQATHIIWPETAVPYAIRPGTPLALALGESVPPGKILITGSLRVEGNDQDYRIFNSLTALDHNGAIAGFYDKEKLVPFGEFQPFRGFVPKSWLTPVGDKDFSRGSGPQTLEWPGLPPLSPLICYEAIFPDLATASAHPELLLNVTNDAWFGMSTGPHQHFQMARTRAVEQGIPLVRAANTGITAVVDSYGRIIASLPLGAKGVLDSRLPKSQPHATIYSEHKNIFLLFLIFSALLLILYQRRKFRN